MNYLKAFIVCIVASTATAGLIPEYANCGSAAELVSVEVAECDSKPCFLDTDKEYALAISFIAASQSSALQLKAFFYDFEGLHYDFADLPIPGEVLPGTQYRVAYDAFVPSAISGKHGFVQIQVWDNTADNSVACALILAALPN